ncbi:MAG TPA: hypothetical protein VI911_08060 [Patescibacteria group bacterium]|nr:hypothetical protein [Patescibacteria group bacterium]
MQEYSYTKSPVDLGALHYELSQATNISGTLDCLSFNEPTDLHICYQEALSTASKTVLDTVVDNHLGQPIVEFIGDLEYFVTDTAIVVDPYTGVSGTFIPMQVLINRRDLYNDTDSPLYVAEHQPILGPNGILQDHADNLSSLNTALSEDGWYTEYIKSWTYPSPMDLLVYYGWLSSFNSAANSWTNEKVAQDIAKYNYIVLGDGIQTPTHGDYSNTQIIIPRVKALNPRIQIFGYVTANQDLSVFQTKTDNWDLLNIDGIFIDEAGYDYGVTRDALNTRIDYVHNKTYSKLCFVNTWNLDHILGIDNDPNYPNTIYNTTSGTSNLTSSDWCLLESFPINTASYTSTAGYESKTDWAARGSKANIKRYEYGVNMAAVGIIDNSNSNGQELFNFGFVSAMMWNLDAFGTSDVYYGANSAAVTYWNRPKTEGLGREWSASPSVQLNNVDNDMYLRYLDFGKLVLDFSSGAETCCISKSTADNMYSLIFRAGSLTEGITNFPHKTTASGCPITGLAYDDTVEESMYGSFEIPSNWKRNTDILMKISFFNDYSQTGATSCRWALEYQVFNDLDVVENKPISTVVLNKPLPDNASADTFLKCVSYIPYNDANSPLSRDAAVSFRIYRDSTDAADTMVNDAILLLLTFDILTEVI